VCEKGAKMAQFQGFSALAILTAPDSSGAGFVGMARRAGLDGSVL
jgi:hypothetical protein